MPASIRDIANKAKVSAATVSRVLRDDWSNGFTVTAQTRQRIMDAAVALNYRPNDAARAMAKGRTGIIGVAIGSIDASFFTAILVGIQSKASQLGMSILIQSCYQPGLSDAENEVMLAASLRSRRLDGFIAVHYPLPQAAIDELHRQEAPLVMLSPQATPNCAAVHINDYNGGRAVGRHLLDLGHRRIAFLGAPGVYSNNRRLGLREVLADAGVEPYELISDMRINEQPEPWREGQSLAEKLFASNTDVTAVVCSDDFKAVGVLTAARRAELTVPDDLSIVGYDNFYWTSFTDTPLTTIHQPKEDQGACAVELLQELLDGMPPREVWLEPELIIRGSTAQARNKSSS